MNNVLKTGLLMALLMGFCLFAGELLGGRQGLVTALLFGGLGNVFMYWFSDKLVLRMNGAQAIEPSEAPRLHAVVRDLAAGAGIPMPRLYLMDTEVPNAFATGRNPDHSAVAVTRGLLDRLDDRELRAVVAHELNHVLHRDILISTIAGVMAGAVMVLARMAMWGAMFGGGRRREEDQHPLAALAMLILAPVAASLIQLAISRSREFHADEGGARLCGDPLALADALEKLELSAAGRLPSAAPVTAHLYIVNPFSLSGVSRLFRTHPPTSERIARLEAMAGAPAGASRRPGAGR